MKIIKYECGNPTCCQTNIPVFVQLEPVFLWNDELKKGIATFIMPVRYCAVCWSELYGVGEKAENKVVELETKK